MNGAEVLDEYLDGLLQGVVAAEAEAAAKHAVAEPQPEESTEAAGAASDTAAAASASVAEDADSASAAAATLVNDADAEAPVAGPSQEQIAAAVLAEMLDDPAFAADVPDEPVAAAPTQEQIAAAVLAEMLDDPAFAADVPDEPVAAAPSQEQIAAAVLAEMLDDPAFAADVPDGAVAAAPSQEQIAAAVLAEMLDDPAFAADVPDAPIAAAPSQEQIAAAVLAEMLDDPAFAATGDDAGEDKAAAGHDDDDDREAVAEMQMMQADRVARAAPPKPPGLAPRPAPMLRRPARPASRLPSHVQALFQPTEIAGSVHADKRASDRSSRWLRLRCGEQTYALELLKVQEVVLPTPLLALRGTSRAMLGVMNLRGQVVPVLDLGIHLGASAVEMDAHTRVVVLEENGETMGLRVSAVEDVTSLTDQQIEPPDTTRLVRISNQFFRGVARIAHQPMILLDASQLLH